MSILRLTSKRQQHDNQTRSNLSDGSILGIGTLYSGAQEISGLEIMQLVEDASDGRMTLRSIVCSFQAANSVSLTGE